MSESLPKKPGRSLEKAGSILVLAAILTCLLGHFKKSLLEAARIEQAVSAQETKDFNSTRLAEALRPFVADLDEPNQKLLLEILTLMDTDMDGVQVHRSDFAGKGKVRALTTMPRLYEGQRPPSITLNENWDPSNRVDLVLAVHELGHVADIKRDKKTLDKSTWEKVYGHPGNSVEVRTELKAWELQLVLLDQLSGGLLNAFYEEVLKASGPEEADAISIRYTEELAKKLNVRGDQKGMLRRWLQIYFNYRAPQRFKMDCRWMYDFATQVAGEYDRDGVQVYELALDPKDQKSDPNRCIDPLPEGSYDYKMYYPYSKTKAGVGPGKAVRY